MASLWNDATIPASFTTDGSDLELGMRFRSDLDGFITAIRFWKQATNPNDIRLSLWSNVGDLLGRVTRPGDAESGWQEIAMTPVAITADTTYVVSYFLTPTASYGFNSLYFASSEFANPPLRALQDGADGANGVFNVSIGGGFPVDTFNSTNYWVDVVFETGSSGEQRNRRLLLLHHSDGFRV